MLLWMVCLSVYMLGAESVLLGASPDVGWLRLCL